MTWIGSLEECDLCHDQYPMAWIEFDGIGFLCTACRSQWPRNAIHDPCLPDDPPKGSIATKPL